MEQDATLSCSPFGRFQWGAAFSLALVLFVGYADQFRLFVSQFSECRHVAGLLVLDRFAVYEEFQTGAAILAVVAFLGTAIAQSDVGTGGTTMAAVEDDRPNPRRCWLSLVYWG